MSQVHDDAFDVRLKASSFLAPRVNRGVVLDRPEWYCTWFSNSGLVDATRLAGPFDQRRITYWVHSVASTAEQARLVADHVDDQLINWVPEIDGWNCRRLTPAASQPVQRDSDIHPALYFQVDQFDLWTQPTA